MAKSEQSNVLPEVMALLPEPLKKFLAAGKTEIRADDGDWVVAVKSVPKYFQTDLPAGSILIANNGCGDYLYLVPRGGPPGEFDSQVHVFWHEGPSTKLFAADIGDLLYPPPSVATQRVAVLYHDGQTQVQLGDEVIARDFFFRKPGRVVYVPGISKKNRDMEHHGLCWVGIKFANGARTGLLVEPKTSCLGKSVRFVKRANAVEEMGPDERFE